MRLHPWLYPAAAALAVSCWIGSEIVRTARLEQQDLLLSQRIRHARSAAERAAADSTAKDQKIDWKNTIRTITIFSKYDFENDRAIILLRQQLRKKTYEELLSQWKAVKLLALPDDVVIQTQTLILAQMGERDPQATLNDLKEELKRGQLSLTDELAEVFGKWVKKDSAAGIAWFESEISQGTFDNRKVSEEPNRVRIAFERAIMNSLMESDLQTAIGRVKVLPADERNMLFGENCRIYSTSAQRPYVEIMRACQVSGLTNYVANVGSFLSSKGYGEVDSYMERISATSEERAAIVKDSFTRQLSEEEINGRHRELLEEARGWVATHEPDQVDAITGYALGKTPWELEYEEAAQLALDYHHSTGNDEVLAAFIESVSKSEAGVMIDKIKDPATRARLLELSPYHIR